MKIILSCGVVVLVSVRFDTKVEVKKQVDSFTARIQLTTVYCQSRPRRTSNMSYKPRGILARAVYDKVHNDQYLDGYDMQLVSIKTESCNVSFRFIDLSHSFVSILSGTHSRNLYTIDSNKSLFL